MTLSELKQEIQKYQYFEDTDIIDVALAAVITTRLKLGDPVWLTIVGPSSGGKSQILRPLALTDEKFMHRIDDLTENTFLSGKAPDKSLLSKIGPAGVMVISDLTVIFSKNSESKEAILSQFRMIYDGEMTKYTGNGDKISWKGSLGVLSGSTPSIYTHMEEVADMGERFIYYRMKKYDEEKATRLAMRRRIDGKSVDKKLSEIYEEYVKDVVTEYEARPIELSEDIQERIIKIAMFAERIRTTVHMDWKGSEIDRIPITAMPMRVALQLTAIANGLWVMRKGKMTEKDIGILEWCGYSLANEEKRACLRILAISKYGHEIKTQTVADRIGLSTSTTGRVLQNLASTGVIQRGGDNQGHSWRIINEHDWKIIRRLEGIDIVEDLRESRELSQEDGNDLKEIADKEFDMFGVK